MQMLLQNVLGRVHIETLAVFLQLIIYVSWLDTNTSMSLMMPDPELQHRFFIGCHIMTLFLFPSLLDITSPVAIGICVAIYCFWYVRFHIMVQYAGVTPVTFGMACGGCMILWF